MTASRRRAALSPSRVKDFESCPLKFRLRTIDRIPEPASSAAAKGTLVHSVLEFLYDQPAEERTVSRATSLVEPQWAAMIDRSPEVLDLFETSDDLEQWLESTHALVERYFTLEDPRYLAPARADRERMVETELESGLNVRGIIDRIDRAPSGDIRVVDYKTGKSPNPRYQEEFLFQMRTYALLIERTEGRIPAAEQLIFLGDGRTMTYTPTPFDLAATVEKLDSAWFAIDSAIDAGHFAPRPSRLCDWCSFKDYCPAFNGTPPQLPSEGVAALRTAKRATA